MGYAMIALHPNLAFLISSFGHGYFTRFFISLPFLGNCILLLINLMVIKTVKESPA
jgi:hypothetical protein